MIKEKCLSSGIQEAVVRVLLRAEDLEYLRVSSLVLCDGGGSDNDGSKGRCYCRRFS